MHEYSLVRSLLRQVAVIVQEQGGAMVRLVRVRVGTFAGVEPGLLEIAFQELVRESPFPDAKLVLDEVPLVGRCEDCLHFWELHNFSFQCPRCEGRQIRVISGDTIELVELELEQEQPSS